MEVLKIIIDPVEMIAQNKDQCDSPLVKEYSTIDSLPVTLPGCMHSSLCHWPYETVMEDMLEPSSGTVINPWETKGSLAA